LKINKSQPRSEPSASQKEEILDKKNLKSHKKSTVRKCHFCDKIFNLSYISEHMNRKHSAEMKKEQNVCRICDRKLLNVRGLISHMNRMHGDFFGKFQYYECDYDGKLFKEKNVLISHMRTHNMRINCEICGAEIQPKYLKQHIRDVHADDRKFQCQLCSKSFKSEQTLKNHIQTHNKTVKCSMCPILFPRKGKLNHHVKHHHENPGRFECETCGKKFNEKIGLKSHQKTHDKNRAKPFKCQRCDFSTDDNRSFKMHQKSHEYQDKKFLAIKDAIKCEKCQKFYKNKSALKQHMKQVHPDVPYQCDLCGLYVKMKSSFKQHFLMHLRKQKKEYK
jgi:KRAB domain-containing zinc finger protein